MNTAQEAHWTSREASILAPIHCPEVVEDELDGQAILYDRKSGDTHRLNETALAVWRRCDGRTTIRSIARHLSNDYDVAADTALDDVEQLILLLAEARLLMPAETE
jgi:PqqD family protein of HPr-rel-A system